MSKDKVGKNPLGWIGGGESKSKGELEAKVVAKKKPAPNPDKFRAMTFGIRARHQENIRRMSYWERLPIQKVIDQALEEFFEKQKKYDPVPDPVIKGEGGERGRED